MNRCLSLLAVLVCACGLGTDPQGAASEDSESLSTASVAQCSVGTLGDATSCKDEVTWKLYASDECKAQGLELVRITYDDVCAPGRTRTTKFECCTPPPPPPPPPPACFASSLGGPTSCKDEQTWKRYASDECSAKGQQLVRIDYADSCGVGLTRYTKFECCPASPPPPPPACFVSSLGDPTSCKDELTWKLYATEVCKAKGTHLVKIDYVDSCAPGRFRNTKFECCE